MALTLKSLQIDMHNSFDELSFRIDHLEAKFDTFSDEMDRKMDQKFSAFADEMDRKMDRKFNAFADEMDRKIDRKIDQKFYAFSKEMDRKIDSLSKDIAATLLPYFSVINRMLDDHAVRIETLEKKC